MNKTFSNNRKLYPSFLEFRHTENRRPPQVSATPLETRLQGPAIDTHAHVFRQGLALADTRRHTPDYDATLTQYLALLDAHGVARGVLVQPSFLGTDNSHLVAALRAAAGRLRGVAVVSPDIAAADLLALAEAGVAGIRLNLIGLPLPALDQPAWQELLAHVNTLGWHVECICRRAACPLSCRPCWPPAAAWSSTTSAAGPGPGHRRPRLRLSAAPGRQRPGLGQAGGALSQLAGAGLCAAGREAARLLLDAYTPDRLMWGSDWPHTEHRHLASYTAATQWLDAWIDDAAARQAVLADTPLRLFQFTGEAR